MGESVESGDRHGTLQPFAQPFAQPPGHPVKKPGAQKALHEDTSVPDLAPLGGGARRPLRIALAGGGTGGHLVPGLHLLDWAQHHGVAPQQVLWLTAGRPVEARVLQGLEQRFPGVTINTFVLPLENPSGGPPSTRALLWRTPGAMRLARKALDFYGSQVLLGLGGFTALPSVLAARRRRIPVALYEVNTVAGKATRRLAYFASQVLHAWPDSLPKRPSATKHSGAQSSAPGSSTPMHRSIGPVTGPAFVPVAGAEQVRAHKAALGLDPHRPLLCVLGGSQGAGALNEFVRRFVHDWTAAGWQVVHQVGPGRQSESGEPGAFYQPREFLGDMARWLQASSLVLGRGGASTLAEIAAVGVPSWVVPYPHHSDRHQWRNAQRLGAGSRIVEEAELGEELSRELSREMLDPRDARLANMRAALGDLPIPSGAEELWRCLVQLATHRSERRSGRAMASTTP